MVIIGWFSFSSRKQCSTIDSFSLLNVFLHVYGKSVSPSTQNAQLFFCSYISQIKEVLEINLKINLKLLKSIHKDTWVLPKEY